MEPADYAALPRAAEFVKTISASELQADAACSGWLRKRSEHVKKWNKRWFVLWPKYPHEGDGRLLIYYSKPTDAKARGVYTLKPGQYSLQTEQTRKHNICLVLTTNKPNKWDEVIDRVVLTAEDVEKAVDWARAINSTGIATPRKERKAPPLQDLGGGLGMVIEEGDEEEEEEGESDDEDTESVSGSSEASSREFVTPDSAPHAAEEGVPPLLLSSASAPEPEPEPEPEPTPPALAASSRRIRLPGSKSASNLAVEEEKPPQLAPKLSPTSLSPEAAMATAAAGGGDTAFGSDSPRLTRANRWRKGRGASEPSLTGELQERRPSLSLTQDVYQEAAAAAASGGTPRPAVPVLGLKPWNSTHASNSPMHLDLQIGKELKTLDWSPGAGRAQSSGSFGSREGSPVRGAGRGPTPDSSPTRAADAAGQSPTGADASASEKATAKREEGDGAAGAGRTLAAALRSSIGTDNKPLAAALAIAGGGDVRGVLAVMAEHVNGANREVAELRADVQRVTDQLAASQATCATLHEHVKAGADREKALEAEIERLRRCAPTLSPPYCKLPHAQLSSLGTPCQLLMAVRVLCSGMPQRERLPR